MTFGMLLFMLLSVSVTRMCLTCTVWCVSAVVDIIYLKQEQYSNRKIITIKLSISGYSREVNIGVDKYGEAIYYVVGLNFPYLLTDQPYRK